MEYMLRTNSAHTEKKLNGRSSLCCHGGFRSCYGYIQLKYGLSVDNSFNMFLLIDHFISKQQLFQHFGLYL